MNANYYYYEHVTPTPHFNNNRLLVHRECCSQREQFTMAVRSRGIGRQADSHNAKCGRRLQKWLFQGRRWRLAPETQRILGRLPRQPGMEVFPRIAFFARPRAWRRIRIRQGAQRNPQGAQQREREALRALVQLQGIARHFRRNPRQHLRRIHAARDSAPLLHEA